MDRPNQTAVSKCKLKIVSLSIHVDDVDHGGLVKKLRSYKKSSKANEVLQPSRAPNTKSYVRRLPKEKGPVKPKAALLKPKPAFKQSVGKRNRSVDDVVSDVLNDLNDSKVVKRKKSVEEDDSVGSDENVVSDERGDGDQDQDSNKDVEKESNNDEESNTDEESNKAEESDQPLVNNLITKTVKRKTATKGKKKDVASESDSESEDEMVKKRGKKTKVVLKSKKREHVKGKKKDVRSESDSESEAEMVEKRGKKTKVALKSKKREPDSEDKVLKVKKNLKKKKKQVFDSSSSFEDEKPIMKKKKLDAKKKKKKPMTLAQIKKEKYLRGFPPLRSRTVPCSLFSAIRDSQVNMKSFLSNIGFVVREFNASTYEFKLDKGVVRVTPDKVHDILGVHVGGTLIFDLPKRPLDDDFMKMWFNQFDPKPLKDIHATDISKKLVLSKKVDFMFKVNFLMLFANVMGTADTMKAIVNLTVLRRIHEDTNIAEIDWCGFIHSCLKQSAVPNTLNGFYIGPLTFLILLYLDSTKFERFPVIRSRPAIRNWTTTAMNKRQDLKIMDEVIGRLELHGPWSESELHETESFYESVCSLIEEKLKFISDEKAELEDILRKANTQFLKDVGVRVLYEKYVGVFKDTVLLEEEQVHVDDFHPGDGEKFGTDVSGEKQTAFEAEDVNEEVEDLFVLPSKIPVDVHYPETAEGRVTRSSPKKRISKPSAYLSSPYMNKKTVLIAQVKRLEFVLGNSVFAMQGDTLLVYVHLFLIETGSE
ncbi:hypothetical protein Tco_1040835 [Tanacetum coccineum]|uniref:Uncharacterized protein n=1 Tax=Tanacetum coccineum TaxID=301880 RepID=A0ABQ5GF40_9ASTR